MTDINTAVWAGVASLLIHAIQGGFAIARHFRLHSECCGNKSGISWDISTVTPPSSEDKNASQDFVARGLPEDKSSTAEVGGIVLKRVSFSPPPLGGRPAGE